MSDCFVGEIRLFAGNYAPTSWHFCDGTLLSISDNQILFSLISTTYGGDGRTTFALPDLRGRVPVHFGSGTGVNPVNFAESLGSETVTLTEAQLPAHSHSLTAVATAGTSINATGLLPASFSGVPATNTLYVNNPTTQNLVTLGNNSVGMSFGSGGAHNNIMPSMVMNYIIALVGNYPTRN